MRRLCERWLAAGMFSADADRRSIENVGVAMSRHSCAPEQVTEHLRSDIQKLGKLVRASGAKVD